MWDFVCQAWTAISIYIQLKLGWLNLLECLEERKKKITYFLLIRDEVKFPSRFKINITKGVTLGSDIRLCFRYISKKKKSVKFRKNIFLVIVCSKEFSRSRSRTRYTDGLKHLISNAQTATSSIRVVFHSRPCTKDKNEDRRMWNVALNEYRS